MNNELDNYILNEYNVHITKEYIENILKKYGLEYKVNNIKIFQKAMTHKSYIVRPKDYWETHRSKNVNNDLLPIEDPNCAIPLQLESYENLEFLGDSVIHYALAKYLYIRYPDQNEGFMTKLRTKIESGDTLSKLSLAIGLDKYVMISRYIEKNGGRKNNMHILEDVFEAFIGSLSIDSNSDTICYLFLKSLIESHIDFADMLNVETNYKDLLLKLFHIKKWEDPKYGSISVSGPDHSKTFTMYVKKKEHGNDKEIIIGIGTGINKKKGEQEAAKQAYFKLIDNQSSEDDDEESVEELE